MKYFQIIFILILVTLSSCNKDDNAQPDNEITNEINPNTIIINSQTDEQLDEVNDNNLVFSSTNNQVGSFTIGSVLVSDMTENAPNGYLRKVTSINESNGNVIINTTQAALVDAIKNCEFETNYKIDNSDILDVDTSGNDITDERIIQNPNNTEISFSLNDKVLYDEDGNYSTTNDQITIDGEVSIEFDVDFKLLIMDSELRYFEFIENVTSSVETTVGMNVDVVDLEEEFLIYTFRLKPFTILIPPGIPVPIAKQWLVVLVGIDGSVSFGITCSASDIATASYGMTYSRNIGWDFISEVANEFDYNIPEVYFEGTLEPWAQVRYEIRPYALPQSKISAYVKPSVKLTSVVNSSNPYYFDTSVDFCIYFGGRAQLVIFDNTVAGFEQQFYNECFPLQNWLSENPDSGLPTVTTFDMASISTNSAIGGGEVTNEGTSTVTEKGIVWSTNPNPSLSDNLTNDGTGEGIFASSIDGLFENTTYYVRAYATNTEGTGYGEEIQFSTLQIGNVPILTTNQMSDITETSATSGGNITEDGGFTVVLRGVCWSTSPNPTIDDNTTQNGVGIGEFTSSIINLSPNTIYYIKAYATNSEGTGYGDELSFTTIENNTVTDIDGNIYETIQIGDQIWMKENLKVTHFTDGTAIPNVTDNTEWSNLSITEKAYAYYNNNQNNEGDTYGALYSWGAIMNDENSSSSNPSNVQGICPDGWHIPSESEWSQLVNFLGGENQASGELKEAGFEHWLNPNTGATNSSGFTALPGGDRYWGTGIFQTLGHVAGWWSSTQFNSSESYTKILHSDSNIVNTYEINKVNGLSCRCIKD